MAVRRLTLASPFRSGSQLNSNPRELNCPFLEMPYAGKDLSMVILLPQTEYGRPEDDQPGLPDLEKKLTPENLRLWLAKLDQAGERETRVALPRFTTTKNLNLVPELESLGLTSPFSRLANFAGIDCTTNLLWDRIMADERT